jgi:hypothetical protein
MKSLAYRVEEVDGEFQVWTPDFEVGAWVGSGATREAALRDAALNMSETLNEILASLPSNELLPSALTAPQLLGRALAKNADVYHFELSEEGRWLGSVFVATKEAKRDEIIALIGSLK